MRRRTTLVRKNLVVWLLVAVMGFMMNCNESGKGFICVLRRFAFFIIVEMTGLWGDLRRDLGVC